LLIGAFLILIGIISYAIGFYYNNIWTSVTVGVIGGFIYFLIAYYQGKNLILRVTGAKPANKKEHYKLLNIVEELSVSSGMPIPEVYVINDTAMNAFATGTNPSKASITVTTGLLDVMTREELEGVIAHELSHIQNNDIKYLLVVSVLVGVLLMLSDFLLRSMFWGAGNKKDNDSKGNGGAIIMIIGVVLAILAPIIGRLLQLSISRKREYLADASGAKITRNPQGLASALTKISQDPDPLVDNANRAVAHLFISTPFSKKKAQNAFSTHPPITDRIQKLKQM